MKDFNKGNLPKMSNIHHWLHISQKVVSVVLVTNAGILWGSPKILAKVTANDTHGSSFGTNDCWYCFLLVV